MSSTIIKLNIGGQIFQTTKSTLTKFDGFFKILIETDLPVEKDESNCIFIDRSPKHFDVILNFMRDGDVIIPESEEKVEEIQREAQYYLLEGLVELCNLKRNQGKNSDLKSKLPIINDDVKMLEIIANIEDKPVLMVSYCITSDGLLNLPYRFGLKQFLEKYRDKFDIYFKPYNQAPGDRTTATSWRFAIYDKTGRKYKHLGWYDDVDDGVRRFLEDVEPRYI